MHRFEREDDLKRDPGQSLINLASSTSNTAVKLDLRQFETVQQTRTELELEKANRSAAVYLPGSVASSMQSRAHAFHARNVPNSLLLPWMKWLPKRL